MILTANFDSGLCAGFAFDCWEDTDTQDLRWWQLFRVNRCGGKRPRCAPAWFVFTRWFTLCIEGWFYTRPAPTP
jgi:hypothetical protein